MNEENFFIEVLGADESLPSSVIMPPYPHAHKDIIIKIKDGNEDLEGADGVWSFIDEGFCLGVATADCAAIVFVSDQRYGVLHAGWRGVILGIIERAKFLLKEDSNVRFWVSPILPRFEIKKDYCYESFEQKFDSSCFKFENDKIYLDFKKSIQLILPEAVFDQRSTFDTLDLASWRRDGDSRRNFTVVGKRNEKVGKFIDHIE